MFTYMKISFFSDIHGNLEALKAFLSQREVEESDKLVFLGDIVGYGANPNEVIEEVKRLEPIVIMGNHDYATITGDVTWFNPSAAEAIRWTKKEIEEENIDYLKELPEKFLGEFDDLKMALFHGSPSNPIWEYVYPQKNHWLFKHYLEELDTDLIALGHTHVPYEVVVRETGTVFNPGGLGQPRDGDPRASYAILDTLTRRIDFHRIEYDVESAARGILDSGLPEFLARRLYLGI
jgi:putative phosphoesterase